MGQYVKNRRLAAILLIFALTVSLLVGSNTIVVRAADSSVTITVYHTNDIHGALQTKEISISKLATLKKDTKNSLLLDAGDATQGVALASMSKGENIIRLMNAAGYDGMVLGNHEFDYGQDQLQKNVALAEFPVISANVYKGDKAFVQNHFVVEKDGVKIGIFGLTTQDTVRSTAAKAIQGLTFADEVETAKNEITALKKEGAEIIICLAHLGTNEEVPYTSRDLAAAMTGEYQDKLDVIIDGHSHTKVNEQVNGVQISQTGTALGSVGKVAIEYDGTAQKSKVTGTLLKDSDFEKIDENPEVQAFYNEVMNEQDGLLNEPIGVAANSLWGGYINGIAEGRITETNYGDFIADSMLEAEDLSKNKNIPKIYRRLPMVAVENGGGYRAGIGNGTIRRGDIVNALPFGNNIHYKVVTPQVLYAMMESSLYRILGQDRKTGALTGEDEDITFGGFLQIAGMTVTYQPENAQGSKVCSIVLDGEKKSLARDDDQRNVILATNDYIADGGNGYTMLASIPLLFQGGTLQEAVENKIIRDTQHGTRKLSYPITKNRIVIENDYRPSSYTVSIRVRESGEADAQAMANVKVAYYVDGKRTGIAKTNDEGLLQISLPSGPHSIKLSEEQSEVYVNNYTNAGVKVYTEWAKDYPTLVYAKPTRLKLGAIKNVRLEASKQSVTLRWEGSEDVIDGYEIQYASSKNFEKAKKLFVKKQKLQTKITGLKTDKSYCFRIRSYKKEDGTLVHSEWSKKLIKKAKKK